jgi:hypothetical protein
MLRIEHKETAAERRWVLCGQLAGRWVREFQTDWDQGPNPSGDLRRVVDLSDVTFIDENGEALLRGLTDRGVILLSGSGVATRDLIDGLRMNGRRPVRRMLCRGDDGA